MSVAQASAVNTLWRYLTGDTHIDGTTITKTDVALAMKTLAAPADKRLMAGVSPAAVNAAAIVTEVPA